MTVPRYLEHVTLDTGHSRRSWRHEVGDDAIAILRPLISLALESGEVVEIPGVVGYGLRCEARGQCLRCTVESAGPYPATLVRFGVGVHSRCGAALWRELHGSRMSMGPAGSVYRTSPDAPPQSPWCGVRMEHGIATRADAWDWLGDAERCVAWAWIEREEKGR